MGEPPFSVKIYLELHIKVRVFPLNQSIGSPVFFTPLPETHDRLKTGELLFPLHSSQVNRLQYGGLYGPGPISSSRCWCDANCPPSEDEEPNFRLRFTLVTVKERQTVQTHPTENAPPRAQHTAPHRFRNRKPGRDMAKSFSRPSRMRGLGGQRHRAE